MHECPTTEELSGFIDGKCAPGARERIVTHLSGCADCYAVVSDSLSISEELNRRSRARIRRAVFIAVPAGLAAAAVLLLTLRVTPPPAQEFITKPASELAYRQTPVEQQKPPLPEPVSAPRPSSFSRELTARLSKGSNAASFIPAAGSSPMPGTTFGFSSAVTSEKAAFRVGACLADLEASLAAKDRERSETFANKLFELMKPLEASHGRVPAAAGRGSALARYEGLSAAVEALFKDRPEAVILRFGVWVETAGLAAETGDAAFFQASEISVIRNELEARKEPVGTLKDLAKLEAVVASGLGQPDRFISAKRLLADIKEMY